MCRDPGAVLVIVAAAVEERPPLYATKTAAAADSSSLRILSCQRFPCLAQPPSLKGHHGPASRESSPRSGLKPPCFEAAPRFAKLSTRDVPSTATSAATLTSSPRQNPPACWQLLGVPLPRLCNRCCAAASTTSTVASGSRVGGADKPRDYTATMLLL
ncbi:hypothetical protein NDU88_002006 [Pleurodeles waltl]|uniref:Uncharacterized protein n=1 Tax=Pleurodeles waltl TaxID=8319 RepID=A0AAV7M9S2_PLEWA|nr:hypothetical protein NDU88_002006 [Pleurodeles waltl]